MPSTLDVPPTPVAHRIGHYTRVFGLCQKTFDRLIKAGRLSPDYRVGRAKLYRPETVEAVLRVHPARSAR